TPIRGLCGVGGAEGRAAGSGAGAGADARSGAGCHRDRQVTRRGNRLVSVGVVLGLLVAAVGWPSAAVADSIRDAQWYLRFLDVARAHQISQGTGVVVGVVDTGVDGTHPDLAGNVAQGAEVFFGNKGGNGWTDEDGHGTAMAGLIAAHGHGPGNADGVLGIAPKATILPVRAGIVNSATGPGIRWATDHGARVISLSVGDTDQSAENERAVAYAIQHDVVLVAAAGNLPDAQQVIYPAAY